MHHNIYYRTEILVIAPFAALADGVRRVLAERLAREAGRFRVVVADLAEAEAIARKEMQEGVKVIVSRGGTAELIEQSAPVPVVKIQVSLVDVLQAALASGAAHTAKRIGVAGFENMIYGCDHLVELLATQLTEVQVGGEQEAQEKIARAKEAGMDFLIGDAVSVRVARQMGLAAKTIDSGRQAIYQALGEALLIARVVHQDEVKSEMLRSVVENAQDAIVAVDAGNHITLFNPEAEKLFHRVRYECIGRPIGDFCAALETESPAAGADGAPFLEVYGRQVLVKSAQMAGGMRIYTMQRVSEVQRMERQIRRKLAA